MNELSDLLWKAIETAFEKWRKKNNSVSLIQIAQQLGHVAVRLRDKAARLEEEYKRGL